MFKSNIILIMIIISIFSGGNFSSFIDSSNPSSINSTSTTIENEETIAFNKDLKLYVGNNLQSTQITTLINMIKTSNTNHPDKQISILLNSTLYSTSDELLEAINDINSSDTFTVYFEYSPSGFINKSVITKNILITPSPTPSSTPTPLNSSAPTITPNQSTNINTSPSTAPTTVPTITPTSTPLSGNVSTIVTF